MHARPHAHTHARTHTGTHTHMDYHSRSTGIVYVPGAAYAGEPQHVASGISKDCQEITR